MTAFAAAAVLILLTVARSARHRVPVLELPLLRIPAFALAATSAFAFFIAFAALLLSGVLFLTGVWGHSILRAGLELAPGPTAAAVMSIVASRIAPRVGMSTLGAAGGLLVAGGMALNLLLVGETPDYVATFLPGQLVTGAGVGLAMPAFTAVAVTAVGPARFATAIGISSMFRQVGAALGVAALVAILGTPAPETVLATFRNAWAFIAVAAGVGGALMLAVRLASRPSSAAVATAATPPR
jgi:hypothetical protein